MGARKLAPLAFQPLKRLLGALIFFLCAPTVAFAGAPFLTDDPAPVEDGHWEFYLAAQHIKSGSDIAGAAPIIEADYGLWPNLDLHVLSSLAHEIPAGETHHYGCSDTEIGAKYRFLNEGEFLPEAGIAPALLFPTGDSQRNLGGGEAQAYLPLWLQKSWGENKDWLTYGGAGLHINPGEGNREFGYFGLAVQHQLKDWLALGAELYHNTPPRFDTSSDTGFNVGAIVDFSSAHHLLCSLGRSINGPTSFQWYLAYQLTLPE